MEEILKRLQRGEITVEAAKELLSPYENLGFAKVDHQRKKRQGFPEVIYGEGKTAEQISGIIAAIKAKGDNVLATRVSREKAESILVEHPELLYEATARVLYLKKELPPSDSPGYIAIICAGTSDLSVAEEAAITAEVMGSRVRRIYDVGVAGLHRLLDNLEEIQGANAVVAVAGMEGALPSVVGGLISNPLIAVPTSIGYGANFQGLAALLSMLNACSSGISVVNIDNGFGGAYNAVLIDRLARSPQ